MAKDKKAVKVKKEAPKTRKKTPDKWKKKAWYTIVAPEEFERKEIGETLAEKPENLIGRVILVSGRDLANQPKKQHIKIKFKISKVAGNKASTDAVGHIIKDDFIRRLMRRRSSKIMSVKNYKSKDDKNVKVKIVIVTDRKASSTQKTSIKKAAEDSAVKIFSEIESRKIVDEIVFGTIPNKIYPRLKTIFPIKRIELMSSTVTQ